MLSVVQPLLEGVLYLFTPLFGRQHVLHCTVFLFAEGPRLHWSHFGSSHFGSRHLVPLCWCLCPDRDSDDLPLLSYCFVVLTAAVSSISSIQWEPMTVREENDGKCRKRGDAWQDRYGWTIDGRKEWYSRFCSEKNVCTVGVGWTRSQKLQSLQDNKKQCQKNLGKWAEDSSERLRNEIEDRHAKTEVLGKNIQKESVADAEVDEEIGGLQAGDEKGEEEMHLSPVEAASRQPTFNFQQLFAMGTQQALQQISAMHKELTRNHRRRRRT